MADLKDFGINAVRQNTGGRAAFNGITFQVFASAIITGRFGAAAIEGTIDDLYLRAEDPHARVDDFTAVSDHGPRWHFQMKAVRSQTWTMPLVAQFNADRSHYPQAQLHLVCHLKERQAGLAATRNANGMTFVGLDWIDFSAPEYAYQSPDIRQMLDRLSPAPNTEDSYFAGLKNLVGMRMMQSEGYLSHFLWGASVGSIFTIGHLQKPSASSIIELQRLSDGMNGLKIDISKGVVVISDGVMSTVAPMNAPPEGKSPWWEDGATEGWGLYRALGGLRDE